MTTKNRISIYDSEAIESLRKELRIQPGAIRRIRISFFKKGLGSQVALSALDEHQRSEFESRVNFHTLKLEQRLDSKRDGATKLVFRTRSGFAIESIILRAETGRISLCLSSQVGCAAKCDFCATGRMGMAQNLSREEILDQLVQANQLLNEENRSVRNLVFMGMGEPLHNEEVLRQVLRDLASKSLFYHPPTRILVSTVGIPESLTAVASDFPPINYAISLHSANQEVRQRLIPLAKRHSLDQLRTAIQQLNLIQSPKTTVMIEYLMLDGLTDSQAEARQLVNWLRGLRVHVNLIPYNTVEEAPHLRSSPRESIEAFSRTIRESGLPTTIRYSMGSDIEAACGQLVRQENRKQASRLAKIKS